MQDMPEIAEISKHVMIEESKQGFNIELTDQNGSSMFPEASKEPYERPAGWCNGSRRRSRRCPIGYRFQVITVTLMREAPPMPVNLKPGNH